MKTEKQILDIILDDLSLERYNGKDYYKVKKDGNEWIVFSNRKFSDGTSSCAVKYVIRTGKNADRFLVSVGEFEDILSINSQSQVLDAIKVLEKKLQENCDLVREKRKNEFINDAFGD